MRCRGAGRVHKGPHLLQAPWGLPGRLPGAQNTERGPRRSRCVYRSVTYLLFAYAPWSQLVVGSGGWGGWGGGRGGGHIYSKRIFLAHIITNSSANG